MKDKDKIESITPEVISANEVEKFGLMRTNAKTSLRPDQWELIDKEVVETARGMIGIAGDFRAAGMVTDHNNLGIIETSWNLITSLSEGSRSMSGITKSKNDRQEFEKFTVPIPILHKDFSYDTRTIDASKNGGVSGLDTTSVVSATEGVMHDVEDLIVNGGFQHGGNNVYGMTTDPSRVEVDIAGDWVATPANIMPDIRLLKQAAIANKKYDKLMLYVPEAWMEALTAEDYLNGGSTNMTMLERILKVEGIIGVKSSSALVDGNVILIRMDKTTADLQIAMNVIPYQWDTEGGMQKNFKVMAALSPRYKHDEEDQSGLIHGS